MGNWRGAVGLINFIDGDYIAILWWRRWVVSVRAARNQCNEQELRSSPAGLYSSTKTYPALFLQPPKGPASPATRQTSISKKSRIASPRCSPATPSRNPTPYHNYEYPGLIEASSHAPTGTTSPTPFSCSTSKRRRNTAPSPNGSPRKSQAPAKTHPKMKRRASK